MIIDYEIVLVKNYKYKLNLIFVFLNILLFFFIIKEYKLTKKKQIKYFSNEISYKGEKILKDKLLNDYLLELSDKYISYKNTERKRVIEFFNSLDFTNSALKKLLIGEVSKHKNLSIYQLDTIFLSTNWNFGNSFIIINNVIFLCEILGCHKIILNKFNLKRRWLIINPIYIEKQNITILQGTNIDCKDINILCIYEHNFNIFSPQFIKPQIKTDLIRDEILRNLPKVNIEPESLYIHIRSGDVFKTSPPKYYGQPPYCFYQKIINNTKFKKIFIVSKDNSNIIINILTKKYKNIIYNKNNFEYDISLLSHAYNIVLSVSSFVLSAIKLNFNLKNIWEYDMMKLSQKISLLHHHIYKFPIKYKIYTMKPSHNYNIKMFPWKKTSEQIKLMIEEKCPYDFIIIKPN